MNLIKILVGGRIINLPGLTKEESEQYEPLGSPVGIDTSSARHIDGTVYCGELPSILDDLCICHNGHRMLGAYGKSFDEVVGYRILDPDEELEFREEAGIPNMFIVRYYGKK